jgi:hypothetical protein
METGNIKIPLWQGGDDWSVSFKVGSDDYICPGGTTAVWIHASDGDPEYFVELYADNEEGVIGAHLGRSPLREALAEALRNLTYPSQDNSPQERALLTPVETDDRLEGITETLRRALAFAEMLRASR